MEQSLINIEEKLKNFPQIDIPVKNTFANGMYIREIFVKKGSLIVGKRHRHKTMNMLLKGEMVIYDEHSNFTIKSGWYEESEEYTRKVGYAIEDSVFLNIHVTDETDLDKLEKTFTISEDEYNNLLRGN